MDNRSHESDLEDEPIEIHVDLETTALFMSKDLS